LTEADAPPAGPPPATREKGVVGTVKLFLELVKFEHSIFALPYAYIGALYGAAWLQETYYGFALETEAGGELALSAGALDVYEPLVTGLGDTLWPSWWAILWITVAMVGARSFAFVVNRAVDKEIDARNPRTAGRAVPSGLVKAWELWLFAAIVLAAFLFAVWQLHPITRWLWPIVIVAFLVYPYTKRFTWLCHYWLGLCLGLAPVGAWVAITGEAFVPSSPDPWILGAAVLFWTAGFDIIYATQDIESDRRDGVQSVPARFGVAAALTQTRVVHVATVVLLVAFGVLAQAGWPWYVGVGIAAVLLAYENAIVRPDDLSRVNAAFFTTNGVIAMVVFAGALLDRVLA
jgi:4-hydroxybenzoate polyprenyltransferase